MTRGLRLALVLGVFAAVLIGVGLAVGGPETEIEGAYFNRSVGSDDVAFAQKRPGLLSPSDGNLWLGAGVASAVAAVGAAAVSRRPGSG